MDIKVSVILPSLNVAAYIRECLDSVVSQTLQEIEIICVDAGSTDGTLEILQEYKRRDSRVWLVHSEVRSYGKQVNEGLLRARGKYIAIVDTDDYIAEEMYQELYVIAEEHHLDYVKGDFDTFYTLKGGGRVRESKKTFSLGVSLYGKILAPYDHLDIYGEDYSIWKGIYRKSFLDQYRIRLNESPGAAFQDAGFLLQTLCLAQRAMYVEKSFYRYRLNREGASTYQKTVVQFIFQEYDRLLDEGIFSADMDVRIWKHLYFKLALSFQVEYDKVLRAEQYRIESPYLWDYYLWFQKKIQGAMEEGRLTFADFTKYHRFEIQLLLKSAQSYADYRYVTDCLVREPVEQLMKKIGSEPVVIFGCGKYGKELCVTLDTQGAKIAAFCDNNAMLWETEYGGIKILNPAKCCKKYKDAIYLVASRFYGEEIQVQLTHMGIKDKNIIKCSL